jgi:hypothetical protein
LLYCKKFKLSKLFRDFNHCGDGRAGCLAEIRPFQRQGDIGLHQTGIAATKKSACFNFCTLFVLKRGADGVRVAEIDRFADTSILS